MPNNLIDRTLTDDEAELASGYPRDKLIHALEDLDAAYGTVPPRTYGKLAEPVGRWAAICGLPYDLSTRLRQFGTTDPIAIARFLAHGDRSDSQPA